MLKITKKSNIYKICLHFSKEEPQNLLNVLSQLVLVPISIINWFIFSYLFFNNNPLYSINPNTHKIDLIHNPDLGNQLIAYIFLSAGWIVFPFLKMVYQQSIKEDESVFMAIASVGLYSIFFPNVIVFGVLVFILLFKNAGLNSRLNVIFKKDIVQKIYRKFFPDIV